MLSAALEAEVAEYIAAHVDRGGSRVPVGDGVHTTVRLEEDKLCLLGMVGVRADGRKNWSI